MRWLCLLLLLSRFGVAQTTSLTATITDGDGQAWANGTYAISLYAPNGAPFVNGVPVTPTTFSGSLNGSGALAVTLTSNGSIAPSGSLWQFTLCPWASVQCSQVKIPVNGATQDASAALSAGVNAPRFSAGPYAYGYADGEVFPVPLPGGVYFNVLTLNTRVWNGTVWGNQGGNIPPSGACGGDLGGSFPNCTVVKATNTATTTVTTPGFSVLDNEANQTNFFPMNILAGNAAGTNNIRLTLGRDTGTRNAGTATFFYSSNGAAGNQFQLGVTGVTSILNITSSGNVLVGTTTDTGSFKLDIAGAARAQTSMTSPIFNTGSATNTDSALQLTLPTSGGVSYTTTGTYLNHPICSAPSFLGTNTSAASIGGYGYAWVGANGGTNTTPNSPTGTWTLTITPGTNPGAATPINVVCTMRS